MLWMLCNNLCHKVICLNNIENLKVVFDIISLKSYYYVLFIYVVYMRLCVCVWCVCERVLVFYSVARSYNDMKIIGMYGTGVVGQAVCVMMFGMLNVHNHMDHPSAEVTIMYMLVTRLQRWKKSESWRCIDSDISSKGREVIQTEQKSQTSTNVLRVKCDLLWLLSEFMVHHIGRTYHWLFDFSICFLSPFVATFPYSTKALHFCLTSKVGVLVEVMTVISSTEKEGMTVHLGPIHQIWDAPCSWFTWQTLGVSLYMGWWFATAMTAMYYLIPKA